MFGPSPYQRFNAATAARPAAVASPLSAATSATPAIPAAPIATQPPPSAISSATPPPIMARPPGDWQHVGDPQKIGQEIGHGGWRNLRPPMQGGIGSISAHLEQLRNWRSGRPDKHAGSGPGTVGPGGGQTHIMRPPNTIV